MAGLQKHGGVYGESSASESDKVFGMGLSIF